MAIADSGRDGEGRYWRTMPNTIHDLPPLNEASKGCKSGCGVHTSIRSRTWPGATSCIAGSHIPRPAFEKRGASLKMRSEFVIEVFQGFRTGCKVKFLPHEFPRRSSVSCCTLTI